MPETNIENLEFETKSGRAGIIQTIVRLFRRETTSKEFIPVIDGLRFLAIAMVVAFHLDGYIKEKSAAFAFGPVNETVAQVPNIFPLGFQGVHLFFVISGFILAVPFMRYGLGLTERKISLRTYYLRRLTRLEPPYIISTIAIFFMLVFIVKTSIPLDTLIPSLFASLFYVHSIFYPSTPPYVNPISWSLEMEVQFYLISPFLVSGLCLLKNKTARRLTTLALILGFCYISWLSQVYWKVTVLNLSLFLHYFLSGILLCDIFLLDGEKLKKLRGFWIFILGLLLLIPIVAVNHTYAENIPLRLSSPLMILAFYLIVFGNNWWNRIFSLNFLTLIGGMCYTIYLLHFVVISAVGRIVMPRLYISDFVAFYWLVFFVLLAVIMSVSAVFFLLIEKPCMKHDWYIRLYRRIFRRKTSAES